VSAVSVIGFLFAFMAGLLAPDWRGLLAVLLGELAMFIACAGRAGL